MTKRRRKMIWASVASTAALWLALSAAAGPKARADDIRLTCDDATVTIAVALKNHLVYRKMTFELASRTAERFTGAVLSNKAYLTSTDLALLKRRLANANKRVIGDGLISGDCRFFDRQALILKKAYLKFRGTLGAEAALIRDLLARPRPTALPTASPRTLGELRARALDGLALQLTADAAIRDSVAQFLVKRWLVALDRFEGGLLAYSVETMLRSFALALDPHSNFSTTGEVDAFNSKFAKNYAGIGVVTGAMTSYGLQISQALPGGPAARSGVVHAGDVIVSVDGQALAGLESARLGSLLAGTAGTSVTLKLARVENGGLFDEREVALTREEMRQETVSLKLSRISVRGTSILTVTLDRFYRGCALDLKNALATEAARWPIDALVLDLRSNAGGLLDEVPAFVGLFIKTGPVAALAYGPARIDVRRDDDVTTAYDGPLVIAVNNSTQSASELVAGSLRDYGRALIVGGEHTLGKATVQTALNVNGGGLRLTVASFYTPSGRSTQSRGVLSDVIVPGPSVPLEFEESRLKYALSQTSIAPLYSADEFAANADARIEITAHELATMSSVRVSGRGSEIAWDADGQLAEIRLIAADYARLRGR